eukprot:6880811-Pyramimonas_sp.AAC.1
MRAQRRTAAITPDICKGANPIKRERRGRAPRKMARERRRQIEQESGHIMKKKKQNGQWVCRE